MIALRAPRPAAPHATIAVALEDGAADGPPAASVQVGVVAAHMPMFPQIDLICDVWIRSNNTTSDP